MEISKYNVYEIEYMVSSFYFVDLLDYYGVFEFVFLKFDVLLKVKFLGGFFRELLDIGLKLVVKCGDKSFVKSFVDSSKSIVSC